MKQKPKTKPIRARKMWANYYATSLLPSVHDTRSDCLFEKASCRASIILGHAATIPVLVLPDDAASRKAQVEAVARAIQHGFAQCHEYADIARAALAAAKGDGK